MKRGCQDGGQFVKVSTLLVASFPCVIIRNGLELAYNGGSCAGISLKRDKCHLHLKRLSALASVQASSSPITRIRIWSIYCVSIHNSCSLSIFPPRFASSSIESFPSTAFVCWLVEMLYIIRVRLLQGKRNASYVFNVCRQSLTNDFCASIKIVASLKFDYTDIFYCILKILSSKIISNVFFPSCIR